MKYREVYHYDVSTHSRAEAAAFKSLMFLIVVKCFNTQPRGGGCAKQPHFYLVPN